MEARAGSAKLSWWGPIAAVLGVLIVTHAAVRSAPIPAPSPASLAPLATPTPSPCYGLTYNVTCANSIAASTMAGAAFFDSYSCSPWYESGPEVFHTFTLPAGGFWQVSASLRDITVDLDVFLLGPQGCSPNLDCVDFGDIGLVIGGASGGATYHVVVDGFNGAAGDYHLDIECIAENVVFADAFESGGTGAWTSSFP